MATRNIGGNRQSMALAATGGQMKSRQLKKKKKKKLMIRAPEPFALAARAAVGQPIGYGKPAAHDECAGGGYERFGKLARSVIHGGESGAR
ncbi:hypothetical protein BBAD15_g8816 [Beauveria bassiana D1-5]|uniref:Uncharacterized protein n=1 Tax=Beauveria bassiana D1-5 TaxID=1245745 RepID=A0A0A2VEB8_BEABA|nr:hypothetical protein BBAD15_g8816 [Beauveria bassiana D1-5]